MSTIREIKSKLKKGVTSAAKDVKKDVLAIIKDSISDFYASYNPTHEYIRTMQLIETIVDDGIKVRNIGASFEIYFDSGAMSHASRVLGKSGRWHRANWSESEIFDVAFFDDLPHGHYPEATGNTPISDIIGYDLRDLDIIIYAALIKAGIPVH